MRACGPSFLPLLVLSVAFSFLRCSADVVVGRYDENLAQQMSEPNSPGSNAPNNSASEPLPNLCPIQRSEQTVALYSMDGLESGAVPSNGTAPNAELYLIRPGFGVSTRISGTSTSGPPGYGDAYPSTEERALIVPDRNQPFAILEGSLEFYLYVPELPESPAAILGKDAAGTADPGHLTASLDTEGRVVVQLEYVLDFPSAYACTKPLEAGRWHHIGLTFGHQHGFLIFSNGEPGELSGDAELVGSPTRVPCGTSREYYLYQNSNPLTIGAYTGDSVEGQFGPVERMGHFFRGKIDELHFSREIKDFVGCAEEN